MAIEKTTIVVADTSGSMREHGKAMLVRTLLAHVRQAGHGLMAPAPEVTLMLWGSGASILTVTNTTDLPTLSIGGSNELRPLLRLLEPFTQAGYDIRILLLSDGHFTTETLEGFRAWLRGHPNVSLLAIAIGPDASTASLARLTGVARSPDRSGAEGGAAGSKGWYYAEEICSVLGLWPDALPTALPTHIAKFIDTEVGATI